MAWEFRLSGTGKYGRATEEAGRVQERIELQWPYTYKITRAGMTTGLDLTVSPGI